MKVLVLVFMVMAAPLMSLAQKIAYADINAIIGVMPENKKVNEDLKIYATGLQKPLDDLKVEQEVLGKQFQKALAAKDTATALQIQEKAIDIDNKLQESSRKAEQQLQQKRSEMMQPALDRIRKALDAIRKRDGYSYILNSIDGAGTTIVLSGPEEDNVTMKLVKELGIELEGQDGAAPAPAKEKKK
jgi:outer membrane protein